MYQHWYYSVRSIFGALESVLCREVITMVSYIRSVLSDSTVEVVFSHSCGVMKSRYVHSW